MKITLPGLQLQFSFFGLSLYLMLLTLLCSLGFWQLGRSEQKQQLIEQQQLAASATALDLNQQKMIEIDSDRYRKVTLRGHYDTAHQFLLDNQVMDGKAGYWVMTPFVIDDHANAVLINRGWVAMGADRKQLPVVDFVGGPASIAGRINRFPGVGIKLAGMEMPGQGWPAVVQLVDVKILSERLGYALDQFQVELDADAENGFRREWKITVAIPPEKHKAYAVQWFGLALALSILFIWIGIKKPQ